MEVRSQIESTRLVLGIVVTMALLLCLTVSPAAAETDAVPTETDAAAVEPASDTPAPAEAETSAPAEAAPAPAPLVEESAAAANSVIESVASDVSESPVSIPVEETEETVSATAAASGRVVTEHVERAGRETDAVIGATVEKATRSLAGHAPLRLADQAQDRSTAGWHPKGVAKPATPIARGPAPLASHFQPAGDLDGFGLEPLAKFSAAGRLRHGAPAGWPDPGRTFSSLATGPTNGIDGGASRDRLEGVRPPSTPSPAPSSGSPVIALPGPGGSSFFVPIAALLALLALVAPAALRNFREVPDLPAPALFVCALERPG